MRLATLARAGEKVPTVVKVVVGLLVAIGLMLGALTLWSRFTALPSTVLTGPACTAPCWQGLRPGQAAVAEVLTFLDQQPFVQGSSVRVWPASGDINQIAWLFQRPAPDTAGYAYFEANTCTAVTVVAQGTLTLAEAQGKFGQPKWLFTQTGKSGLRAWVEVDLVYPAAGYVVEADVDAPAKSDKTQVTLSGRTPVMRVTYFDPARFEALLAGGTLINGPAGLSQTNLRPWPGLGTIDFTPS